MVRSKKVRRKGKINLSRYFKKFEEGGNVAIVRDLGVRGAFPQRINGKSGKVMGSRGNFKMVEIKDGGKTKTFIIHPIHLKEIGSVKKK